jgi:branched-chain amino acid transport system permease protein
MALTTIILQTLNGLTIAAIYVLLASGLTIVLGLQGIINVAHGFFYMLGAYLGLTLIGKAGLNFWLSLPLAFIATFSLGVILEISGLRPLTRWHREHSHQVILTLGFAIFGTELVKEIWGAVPQMAQMPPSLEGVLVIGAITYPKYWLFVMAFSVAIMVGLWVFFTRTGLGILVRSVTINREVSEALGTNAPLLTTMIFGLGTGIAGVAGVLAGPILSVDPNMGFELLMILFVVIILGGLGSLIGTVISAVIIGIVIAFGTALFSGMVAKISVFAVMIAILILRPLGVLGRGTAVD